MGKFTDLPPLGIICLFAAVTAPAVLLRAQTKPDPYETQYIDSAGPRLTVEPRKVQAKPTPRPTPTSTKFRYETEFIQPDQKAPATIERPGRAPRPVSAPVDVSTQFLTPTPAALPTPAPVVSKPVKTVKTAPTPAPVKTVKTAPAPTLAPEPAPVVSKPVKTVKTVPVPTPAPQPAPVVSKPKFHVVEPTVTSTENSIKTAREIESESVGVSERGSLAVVPDDDGSFRFARIPVRISVDLREGYDTNVYTTTNNPQASWFTNIAGRATYEFGTARTQGLFDLSGGYTGYYEADNTYNARFGAQLTHKVSPRLTLRANAYAAYEYEPDFGLVGGSNRQNGSYFYGNFEVGAAYAWTQRFSTDTSYKLATLFYDDEAFAKSEDRIEQTFSQSFRFLVLPPTVAVLEYRLMLVNYTQQSFRDSLSNFVLVGADHSFSNRLSGSFRAGAEFRSNDATSPTDDSSSFQTSPYFEGNLLYAFAEKTSGEFRLRYGLEQSDVASDLDREVFRLGLAANHAFTARISGALTVDYNHSVYEDGTGFDEDSIDTSVSLRYTINRNFSLELAYIYTDVISGEPNREYDRSQTFFSARAQF